MSGLNQAVRAKTTG